MTTRKTDWPKWLIYASSLLVVLGGFQISMRLEHRATGMLLVATGIVVALFVRLCEHD